VVFRGRKWANPRFHNFERPLTFAWVETAVEAAAIDQLGRVRDEEQNKQALLDEIDD